VPLKPFTLKLPLLLAKYLFTYNELNLAGMGRFQIETSELEMEIPEKNSKPVMPVISFQHDITIKEDDKLVAFISSHSGKMKSLAASDLESYLEQAKEFMNIGKPFMLEGIGTLIKINPAKYEFTQVNVLSEKIKENLTKETEETAVADETYTDFSEIFSPKKPQAPASKKIVLLLAVLTGLGLAIWGGFVIYKNYFSTEDPTVKETQPVQIPDTTATNVTDTTVKNLTDTGSAGVFYKFIVEQADSLRAFTRYNYLRKWGINIEMETTDSILFKLFFRLSVLPADTSRIRDSLNLLYGTKGKTIIE
jgi:hypothetical protein